MDTVDIGYGISNYPKPGIAATIVKAPRFILGVISVLRLDE